MTKIPRFLAKHRRHTGTGGSWGAFSEYLDHLDSADWLELLEDLLATRSAAVYEVVAPPPSSSLLAYAGHLLSQCSAVTLGHCAEALDRIIGQCEVAVAAGASIEPVLRALRLMEMLGAAARPHAAAAMVLNTRLPDAVRAQAALVVSHRETHLNWRGVDLRRDPFLLPALVVALTQSSPASALRSLVAAPAPPGDPVALSYPLRIALRRLCHHEAEGGLAGAGELLKLMPAWHWSRDYVWNETLQLREFIALREQLGLAGVAPPAPPAADPGDREIEMELERELREKLRALEAVWEETDEEEWVDPAAAEEARRELLAFAGAVDEGGAAWRGEGG